MKMPDVYIQIGEFTLGFSEGELFSVSRVSGEMMCLNEANQKKLGTKIEKTIGDFWNDNF